MNGDRSKPGGGGGCLREREQWEKREREKRERRKKLMLVNISHQLCRLLWLDCWTCGARRLGRQSR
jgi:hypothetical protein